MAKYSAVYEDVGVNKAGLYQAVSHRYRLYSIILTKSNKLIRMTNFEHLNVGNAI